MILTYGPGEYQRHSMARARRHQITAAARRVVMVETFLSTAINALIPSGIIWLLGVAPPQTLTGKHGVVPGIVAGTALPIFFMTIFLTQLLRRRRRAGLLPPLFSGTDQRRDHPSFGSLLGRSVGFTLAGVATLAPAAMGIINVLGLVPMNGPHYALFNIGYGAIVGMTVTPFIVWAALADGR